MRRTAAPQGAEPEPDKVRREGDPYLCVEIVHKVAVVDCCGGTNECMLYCETLVDVAEQAEQRGQLFIVGQNVPLPMSLTIDPMPSPTGVPFQQPAAVVSGANRGLGTEVSYLQKMRG